MHIAIWQNKLGIIGYITKSLHKVPEMQKLLKQKSVKSHHSIIQDSVTWQFFKLKQDKIAFLSGSTVLKILAWTISHSNSSEPENLLFVQDYAKLVQQRSLLEVAILCLIFGSDQERKTSGENMSSNWKISDLSKSLVSFLMGGQQGANNNTQR